jgi:hypothetical protein
LEANSEGELVKGGEIRRKEVGAADGHVLVHSCEKVANVSGVSRPQKEKSRKKAKSKREDKTFVDLSISPEKKSKNNIQILSIREFMLLLEFLEMFCFVCGKACIFASLFLRAIMNIFFQVICPSFFSPSTLFEYV